MWGTEGLVTKVEVVSNLASMTPLAVGVNTGAAP